MPTHRWLLTTEDVQELTGKQTHNIRAAMRSGKLAASNKSGRWVTTRQAVADWLGLPVDDIHPVPPQVRPSNKYPYNGPKQREWRAQQRALGYRFVNGRRVLREDNVTNPYFAPADDGSAA